MVKEEIAGKANNTMRRKVYSYIRKAENRYVRNLYFNIVSKLWKLWLFKQVNFFFFTIEHKLRTWILKAILIHPVLIIYLRTVGKSSQSILLHATNCLDRVIFSSPSASVPSLLNIQNCRKLFFFFIKTEELLLVVFPGTRLTPFLASHNCEN